MRLTLPDGRIAAHRRDDLSRCAGSHQYPIAVVPRGRTSLGDGARWCARCAMSTPHDALFGGRVQQCVCCLHCEGDVDECIAEARMTLKKGPMRVELAQLVGDVERHA